MEIHQRFMTHPTTEVLRFIIKTAEYPRILPSILAHFVAAIKNIHTHSFSLQILKTIHTIYCTFYQQKFNPDLGQNSTRKFNQQFSVFESNQIDVKNIQNLLCTEPNNKQSQHQVKISIVLDILVLHMSLFCTETAIWKYFEELQVLIRFYLLEKKDVKYLDVKLMECYMNSLLLLHLRNSDSTEKLQGVNMSDLYLNNVELLLTLKNRRAYQILTLFVPKFEQIIGKDEILSKILEMIFKIKNDPGDTLFLLYLTANLWIPSESDHNKALIDQILQESFWLILLNGLSSSMPEQRKQALYLTKKAVDYVHKHRTQDFELGKYQEIKPLVCVGNDSQQNSFKQSLSSFFLILEAFEEPQNHSDIAVSSIQTLFNGTFDQRNPVTGIHIAWIRCALTRILQHDNKDIIKRELPNMFSLELELYDDNFLSVVLGVLNNTYLYEIQVMGRKPIVVEELIKLLNNVETKNTDLVTKFMMKASKIRWNPVALYYIIHAMSMANQVGSIWKEIELEAVKSLAVTSSIVLCPILGIRSQIELLETITHFAIEPVDLMTVAETLAAFSTDEALIRGQLSWKRVCVWLSEIIKEEEAIRFLEKICRELANENFQQSPSMKLVSLMLMLFHDAHLILTSKSCPGLTALRNLLRGLHGAASRPYANAELINRLIQFISHLLGFVTLKDGILCELISDYTNVILSLTYRNLRKTVDEAFVKNNNIKTYVSITQQILTTETSFINKREVLNHIERFEVESWNIIDDGEFSNNVQRLFGIKILHACLKATGAKLKNYKFIGPLYNTYKTIKDCSPVDAADVNNTLNESSNVTRRIAIEYYTFVAELFHEYTKDVLPDEWVWDINWIEQVSYLIQVGGADIFVPLVGILSQLFYKEAISEIEMDNFKSAMRLCWKSLLGFNKPQLALEEMMNLIFSSPFLEAKETRDLTVEFTREMLDKADDIPGISITLVKGLKQAKAGYLNNFYEAILACLLYGTNPDQDQKIELQARSYILECYQEVYPNYLADMDININTATRAHAVTLLHKMITDEPAHAVILLPLMVAKLEESQGTQDLADSQMHRLKHRIMQVLLILQPVLEKDHIESLHSLMCDNILNESGPPSTKIMQEWLLSRIYIENEELRTKIWDLFDQGQKKQMKSLCSVISVVYHVARSLSSDSQVEFINLAIEYIMPCCMILQVDVRLYAQVILSKLYDLAMEMNCSLVTEKYKQLYIAVSKSLKYENGEDDANQMLGDFYFTVFNPIDDYSLETLFYDLPRLLTLPVDEYIPPQMFEKFGFKESNSHPLKLLNLNDNMSDAQVSEHVLRRCCGSEDA